MSKIFRVDYFNQTSEAWEILITAGTRSSDQNILTSLDGWVESPSLNRNSAAPLFGDGEIDSPVAYFAPRFFTATIFMQGDDEDEVDTFRSSLQKVEYARPNFKVYLANYDETTYAETWYELLDAKMDTQWITQWVQKKSMVEFSLAFKASNPKITRNSGGLPEEEEEEEEEEE